MIKYPWIKMRTVTDADSPTLAAGTMGDKPSGAFDISSPEKDILEVICAMAGSDGDTATFNIWAGRGDRGPARLVCTVIFTAGTMEVVDAPDPLDANSHDYFADTATLSNRVWPHSDYDVLDDGNNRIATLKFDAWGSGWVYAECTNLTGATRATLYLGFAQIH